MESKKINLLIADDEQDILELLEGELSEMDKSFQISLASSGYEALNYIGCNQVDLLITDIAMADMDGFELYQRVKEIRPNMPIIMMTGFGYDPNHVLVNTKKAGLKSIIFKPFDMDKLIATIYKSLEEANGE